MRPVLLRMDGFAAFREPAVVDFRDAEYFVLVGPTGAGKSTVIDAMTFALYGSVPRWDNRGRVGLALAPTAGHGSVGLVFDVGGERYVVARELRRAPSSGKVTVREARLERLADPAGTGEPGEETIPVAAGAAKVSAAVEELLGLPFEDFCTCVVLPQGEFAEFLHAAPGTRQEKLERILGLGVYDLIMRKANVEATAQQQRADLLDDQLVRYADATGEAEAAAARRADALAGTERRVADAVPRLADATAELDAAETAAATAEAERVLLAGLRAPDGVDRLDERRRAATGAVERAREAADGAERADTAARAERAAAPDRVALERAAARHAERDRLVADRPGLADRRERCRSATGAASAAVVAAEHAEERARAAREDAVAAARTAEEVVTALAADRDALAAPAPPDGLDELDRRRTAAATTAADAARVLAGAEDAEEKARAAVADAPVRAPLDQALRDHRDLAAARAARTAADAALTTAESAESAAATALAAARHRLGHARDALAAAERSDLAAALRPALTVGDDCPVCAQAVGTLPPPLPDGDATRARAEAAAAEHEHTTAQAARHRAEATARTARDEAGRTAAEVARLESALAGFPDADGVRAALADTDERHRALDAADAATRAARRERDAADERVTALRRETDAVAARLRAAREPLARLGPVSDTGDAAPLPPDPDDPVAGWRALLAWAADQRDRRDAALPGARAASGAAVVARDDAGNALVTAREAAAAARREETAAVRAEQEAESALAAADGRADELRAALDGAPSAAGAAAGLERVAELDRRAADADAALRAARAALREAESGAERTGRDVTAAWDELRRARDPLVALAAPVPDGTDLVPAWAALTGWAESEAAVRADRAGAASAEAERVRGTRDALLAGLRDELRAHDVPLRDGHGAGDAPAQDLARWAPTAVATALAGARTAHDRIVERRNEAARLAADRAAAQEAQQVAKLLGDQLRSDRFPRWLVASALDALVADASVGLAGLSGGQFSLTHDKGEFLVVDHADADARRPVKTLSGGETFQASLALALALSDQLAGLAAAGAPRLESIFLDEGFGTLDEANLETVAGTLENLATRGDRMVGVITHVAALAERVPVRFTLRRTQRTSTIEREAPA